METTIQVVLVVINSLVLIIIGAGGYVIKEINRRLTLVEQEQKEMKVNYLDRFADAKQHTTDEMTKILNAINEIKIVCAKFNHDK